MVESIKTMQGLGSVPTTTTLMRDTRSKIGGAGYRSLCLVHAKHALYHLSYTPMSGFFTLTFCLDLSKMHSAGFEPARTVSIGS
jgi:hypothetical protein